MKIYDRGINKSVQIKSLPCHLCQICSISISMSHFTQGSRWQLLVSFYHNKTPLYFANRSQTIARVTSDSCAERSWFHLGFVERTNVCQREPCVMSDIFIHKVKTDIETAIEQIWQRWDGNDWICADFLIPPLYIFIHYSITLGKTINNLVQTCCKMVKLNISIKIVHRKTYITEKSKPHKNIGNFLCRVYFYRTLLRFR